MEPARRVASALPTDVWGQVCRTLSQRDAFVAFARVCKIFQSAADGWLQADPAMRARAFEWYLLQGVPRFRQIPCGWPYGRPGFTGRFAYRLSDYPSLIERCDLTAVEPTWRRFGSVGSWCSFALVLANKRRVCVFDLGKVDIFDATTERQIASIPFERTVSSANRDHEAALTDSGRLFYPAQNGAEEGVEYLDTQLADEQAISQSRRLIKMKGYIAGIRASNSRVLVLRNLQNGSHHISAYDPQRPSQTIYQLYVTSRWFSLDGDRFLVMRDVTSNREIDVYALTTGKHIGSRAGYYPVGHPCGINHLLVQVAVSYLKAGFVSATTNKIVRSIDLPVTVITAAHALARNSVSLQCQAGDAGVIWQLTFDAPPERKDPVRWSACRRVGLPHLAAAVVAVSLGVFLLGSQHWGQA